MPQPGVKPEQTADLLHSAAIKLLRRLRRSDVESGLTAAQASVISVLVYAGPHTLTDLAAIEQVRAPTMSRLIAEMERLRLIERTPLAHDARSSMISATRKARTLLDRARKLRLDRLESAIARLSPSERVLLHRAAELTLDVARDLEG